MAVGTVAPGVCPKCGLQNPPGASRCVSCSVLLPLPYDIDHSGAILMPRTREATRRPGAGPRVPWWVFFWTGAILVWLAIFSTVLLGFSEVADVAILAMLFGGLGLISFSYRVLINHVPAPVVT